MSYIIVDDNGQIIRTVDTKKERISVRSYKQDRAYYKLKKGKSKSFTFTEMRNVEGVVDSLTTNQAGYLLVLSTYIDYDGRIINGSKEPMTTADMLEVLKLKKTPATFYRFFDSCVEHGIIIEDDNGTYFMNDQIHFKGKAGNQPLVKIYSTTIRELFNKNKVSDLGNLYKLQSKIHKTKNVLALNPESPEEEIEFMTRQAVADLLGISTKQVSVVLNRLKLEGMKVVASIRIGNQTRYVVNPELVARNIMVHDETLRTLFKK